MYEVVLQGTTPVLLYKGDNVDDADRMFGKWDKDGNHIQFYEDDVLTHENI